MSYARVLAARISANPAEVLGPQLRVARQILHGADPWEVLGDPSSSVRRMLVRRFGAEVVHFLAQLHTNFYVTAEMAEHYWRWHIQGAIVGTYDELTAMRASAGLRLGQLFEADHILEARIHRMIRDGIRGHVLRSQFHHSADYAARAQGLEHSTRGTPEFAISDGMALLVPSNEIVAWRIHRQLASGVGPQAVRHIAPQLYPHQGVGSKTSRVAQIIPWGLEGTYAYRELLDGSVWVACREFGLSQEYARTIQGDLVASIRLGVREDPETAQLVLRWLRQQTGRTLTPDSEQLIPALLRALPIRGLDDDFLSTWSFRAPMYPVPFEDVTREIFGQ